MPRKPKSSLLNSTSETFTSNDLSVKEHTSPLSIPNFTPPPASPSLRRTRSLRRSNSISSSPNKRKRSKSKPKLPLSSSSCSSSSSSSSSVLKASPSVDSTTSSSLFKSPTRTTSSSSFSSTKKGHPNSTVSIEQLSIYRHPWTILKGFLAYLIYKINQTTIKASQKLHRNLVIFSLTILIFAFIYTSKHPLVLFLEQKLRWYGSWIILGILSSVGLGTGLHTFIMFLGPHIAQVTTAAYSCGHLDFATEIWEKVQCTPLSHPNPLTILQVASLVKLESFLWGLGTALGELPPYFVAKAARDTNESTSLDPLKKRVAKWIKKFGFFSILLFASVPNPLFDLAGIICGSGGIPLSTFFLATLIGKAIIKTSLQVLFVVTLFSPSGRHMILDFLSAFVPQWHDVFRSWLETEMRKYFHPSIRTDTSSTFAQSVLNETTLSTDVAWIPFLWNGLIVLMLIFFVFSIIESLAKRQLQRQRKLSS